MEILEKIRQIENDINIIRENNNDYNRNEIKLLRIDVEHFILLTKMQKYSPSIHNDGLWLRFNNSTISIRLEKIKFIEANGVTIRIYSDSGCIGLFQDVENLDVYFY